MKYVKLGRTGLTVSRLCLGTMNFGPQTDEKTSHEIMDRALELGLNFFDTANVYGGSDVGITESIVGRWLAQGGHRERVVLATKVYGRMGEGPNERGLSALHIKRACEASLRRLQTDYLDLYQMHHVQRSTPWEEIWDAMDQLRREGKILYVGSSNFAGWDIATANQIASRRHSLGLVSEQSLYNLVARTAELEVIPACRHYGVGLIPWSPLAGGFLAGGVRDAKTGRRTGNLQQSRFRKHADPLGRYEALCAKLGESPANVAVAWLLANPVVTAPILGPRTLAQLDEAARTVEIRLDDETLGLLDEIWPGPGGEAPEAYAW